MPVGEQPAPRTPAHVTAPDDPPIPPIPPPPRLLGGRLARRVRNPWRGYGPVEAGAALAALMVPRALGAVTALYVALAGGRAGAALVAARFVVAALVAVPPALVAGMTLPFGAR